MFKKELAEKMAKIFQFKKVTFSQPGESKEQECIFIEVTNSWNTVHDGKATSRVAGKIALFGNSDKLPYGFMSKQISKAGKELTKDLVFHSIEENTQLHQNIVQRDATFTYFFEEQYNPAKGEIQSVEFTFEES